eukprot:scaffold128093_cov63-Phaeocystis_antarctica.AAC.3
MIKGVIPIAASANPACPIAKLTRSLRPAADSRAARNALLTAAWLAAPELIELISDGPQAGREDKVPPWPPTLDAASELRRSRRQPARPSSSKVGSRAMAKAAAKPIVIVSKRCRGVAAGAQAGELGQPRRKRVEAHTAVARQRTPLPGPGVKPRAVMLVAGIFIRLALVPVAKAGSVTRHAAAPTLGGAEPRLVLVEPKPQAIRRSELCRHEVIFLLRGVPPRSSHRSTQRKNEVERSGGTKKQAQVAWRARESSRLGRRSRRLGGRGVWPSARGERSRAGIHTAVCMCAPARHAQPSAASSAWSQHDYCRQAARAAGHRLKRWASWPASLGCRVLESCWKRRARGTIQNIGTMSHNCVRKHVGR